MMQSQGLGALMPQGAQQMAPQQADPQRLAAATNLVSSDAERQILDPRTLALIKYKDALQAMQAADQMMAAAQPAPMPPTVAERTKLAAEQGIAGLASKLGAGIQQQGNNMQAQQMQQAMSGGLPQLPAPNMAGMAQGGIVGFQEGGRPEDEIINVLDEQGNEVQITQAQYDALMSQYDASIRGQEDADAVRIPPSQATQADRLQARARDFMGGLRGLFDFSTEGTNLGRVREIADEKDLPFLTRATAYPTAVGLDFLDTQSRLRKDLSRGVELAKQGVSTAVGQAGEGVDLARGEQPAVQPTAQTSTAAQGRPVVPRQVQPAQQGFTPAPESMSGGMREPTPVERLRAAAAENTAQQGGKDAVDALLEEEQQPRAGESAADRDARRRMLIAGLRGFGAQGLGGFAAGTAEEELRQEQEVIADQERQRRAAMETRGFDLEERNITLQDAIRRQQADALQADREARIALQQAQLDTQQKEIIAQTVLEEAPGIQAQIDAIELELADPDFGVGFFGGTSDRDERVEELRRLRAFMVNKTEEVMSRFGFTSPGAGGASGSSGLAPEDDALVNAYLGK